MPTVRCQIKGCPVVLRVPVEDVGPVLCAEHRQDIEQVGVAPPRDDGDDAA